MKVSFLFAMIMVLSGCAATRQDQQQMFDNKPQITSSGKYWTVNQLKDDYLSKTGNALVVNDTLDCGWDDNCYYNKWSKAHDEGINKLVSDRIAKEKSESSKCDADEDCKRNKDLKMDLINLGGIYRNIISTHIYFQSDYDAAVRGMCEKVTEAQKNGVSREKVITDLQDLPGIAPEDRVQIISVAKYCWGISKNKGNWKEALRIN